MPFMKRLVILAAITIAVTLVYLFGFKPSAQNLVKKNLTVFEKSVADRGDGSSFSFFEPQIQGKTVKIQNTNYVDGKSGAKYVVGEMLVSPSLKGRFDIQLKNITVTPENGEPLTTAFVNINQFSTTTQSPTIDDISFESLSMSDVKFEGKITSNKSAGITIAAINAKNLQNGVVKMIALSDISMGTKFNPSMVSFPGLELNDVSVTEIQNIGQQLNRGQVPITLMQLTQSQDFNVSDMNELLGESNNENVNQVIDGLLGLFMENAPKELRDLADGTNPAELGKQLEEFQNQPAEKQAEKALELLMNALKNK